MSPQNRKGVPETIFLSASSTTWAAAAACIDFWTWHERTVGFLWLLVAARGCGCWSIAPLKVRGLRLTLRSFSQWMTP